MRPKKFDWQQKNCRYSVGNKVPSLFLYRLLRIGGNIVRTVDENGDENPRCWSVDPPVLLRWLGMLLLLLIVAFAERLLLFVSDDDAFWLGNLVDADAAEVSDPPEAPPAPFFITDGFMVRVFFLSEC